MRTYLTRIEKKEGVNEWIKFTANGRKEAIKKSLQYKDFYKGKHKGTLEKLKGKFKYFEIR